MISWLKDLLLELRINWEFHRLMTTTDRLKMRAHAKRMADLVKQRSPRQLAKIANREQVNG